MNKKFLSSSLFSVLASLISNCANFIIISLLIDKLGKSNYGEYSFLFITISSVGTTIGLSTGVIATNYASMSSDNSLEKIYKLLTSSIFFAFFAGILIYGMFFFQILPYFGNSFSVIFLLTFTGVILATLDSFYKSVVVGLERILLFSITTVSGSLIYILGILFFQKSLSQTIVLICYIFSLFVMVIIIHVSIKIKAVNILKLFKYNNSFFKIVKTNQNRNVLLNIFASVFGSFALWFMYASIRSHGNSNDLADFNIGYQFYLIISFLPIMTNRILIPFLIKAKNKARELSIIRTTILLNISMSLFAAIVIYFFNDFIFEVLSKKIVVNQLILLFMSIAAIFSSVASPVGQYLFSKFEYGLSFKFNLIFSVLLVGLGYISIYYYQAVGAAFAFAISYLIHSFNVIYYFSKKIEKNG
jgi:O-antigen/teichoic acid export membrane protein